MTNAIETIDLGATNVTPQTIEGLTETPKVETVVNPQDGVQDIPPVITDLGDTPPIGATPPENEQRMTYEEFLAMQQQQTDLSSMKDKQEELDAETIAKIEAQTAQVAAEDKGTTPPDVVDTTETPPVESEGDEPGKDAEKRLLEIKNYSDNKIAEANQKNVLLEQERDSDKKLFDVKEQQYLSKIDELGRKIVEIQSSSINGDDESVKRFDYLRKEFKETGDMNTAKKLGTFHLKSASIYYDVDPYELETAIAQIKNGKKTAVDAISAGYNSGGGVSNPNINKTIDQSKGKLNPDLLGQM